MGFSSSGWKCLTLTASYCLGTCGAAFRAQVTGIEVVCYTAFYGPYTPTPVDTLIQRESSTDTSYLVYVNMTNPTDVLTCSVCDTSALPQGGALGIDAECECWNPISESMVLDATNSSFFWTSEPLWEYDSIFTTEN